MWLVCQYYTHFPLFSVFFTSWTTTENMIRHAMIVDSLVKQHPSVNNKKLHIKSSKTGLVVEVCRDAAYAIPQCTAGGI